MRSSRVVAITTIAVVSTFVLWYRVDDDAANHAARTLGGWVGTMLVITFVGTIVAAPVWILFWWRSRRRDRQ